MSRLLTLSACALVAFLAFAAGHAQPAGRSWAHAQIRLVVSRGLMAKDVPSFRPDDPLTRGELNTLVGALTQQPAVAPSEPAATVTLAQLDARLVGALGLSEAAAGFRRGARGAGLTPPSRFGSEVAARLLGLRYNHPAARDALELGPGEPATRAETAFSAARFLQISTSELEAIETAAATFALPALTLWQRRVLTTAVNLIGYPYVWAGTSELPQAPLGREVPGGFDCSGFVWRVYRLQAYPGGEALAETVAGRSAAAMAGEVQPSRRVSFARLAPGDLVFFAPGGPRAKATAVDHAGIYLGGGWMIHSSRFGVALAPITSGWYRDRFAWGRRPLAEAGLA